MAQILGLTRSTQNEDWLKPVPDLPRPRQRWTVRRKAAVIEAVRGGWMPIEEVCEVYNISVDEFLAWERDIDRYGVHGLRATRFQIYRDTDRAQRQQRSVLACGPSFTSRQRRMSDDQSNTERYRREAMSLRQAAEIIRDPRLRNQVLSIAERYDPLAAGTERELLSQQDRTSGLLETFNRDS